MGHCYPEELCLPQLLVTLCHARKCYYIQIRSVHPLPPPLLAFLVMMITAPAMSTFPALTNAPDTDTPSQWRGADEAKSVGTRAQGSELHWQHIFGPSGHDPACVPMEVHACIFCRHVESDIAQHACADHRLHAHLIHV